MILADHLRQDDAVEIRAAAQGDVDLAMREGTAAHVYYDAVERLSLTFVDGYRPGETDGVLGESARRPRRDLFCFPVVLIFEELPRIRRYLYDFAVVKPHKDPILLAVDPADASNDAQRTIYPAAEFVVVNEHYLGPGF